MGTRAYLTDRDTSATATRTRPRVAVSAAFQRPVALYRDLIGGCPKRCGHVSRHTSREATPCEPGELRGCPKDAEQLLRYSRELARGRLDLAWALADTWLKLATFCRAWANFDENQRMAKFGRTPSALANI